jgi:P4 family phage/plasmid primase-like protien
MPKYRDFNDFIRKHYVNKDDKPGIEITNTRIRCDKTGVSGGRYHISADEYAEFLSLYGRDILSKKNPEYLTEKQLESGGPIVVDLDFRYDMTVTKRIHGSEHIEDLVDSYLCELKRIYQFDDDSKFRIFVMEKPEINVVAEENIVKDGIHLLIGIQSDLTIQTILRERIIPVMAEKLGDFPITNTWEGVFDERVSLGDANWQLYGSKKPKFQTYCVTKIYEFTYDSSDGEFSWNTIPLSEFDFVKNIQALSVRNKENPSFLFRNDFVAVYNEYKRLHNGRGKPIANTLKPSAATVAARNILNHFVGDINIDSILAIKSKEDLNALVEAFKDSISTADYNLKEMYELTMALPPEFYEKGSYDKWMRVGWALKNINCKWALSPEVNRPNELDKLLIIWVAMSAKAKGFHYATQIPDIVERWQKMNMKLDNGLTKRSIMHWVKQYAPDEYKKIRNGSIDHFIEATLFTPDYAMGDNKKQPGCGDYDLAMVLYQAYKDEFVCVSITSKIWYQNKNGRWIQIDSGTTLRNRISEEMRKMYHQKLQEVLNDMTANASLKPTESNSEDDKNNPKKIRSQKIFNIWQKLARTNDKKNIMTEAMELFFDRDQEFLEKLDANPNLLCFKNGVVDFKQKVFRKCLPEDYLSKCTNTDFIEDLSKCKDIVDELNTFMQQLFPRKELCRYMWEHLASVLIGTGKNQTFNMYIGSGRNGKSILVDLMSKVLGNYAGTVPLSLIQGERAKIGGLQPELIDLKGKRYAVMQEPSKGDKINEGKMKSLTGGDMIQARAPYMIQTMEFKPQFTMVVCTNILMEIKSNDDGTWRRIRHVPFEALFTENPVHDDPVKPFQYTVDKDLKEKFEGWKEVFAAMLVKIAFETDGSVKDCDIVLAASNKYRESQDYIAEFVKDKVRVESGGKIKKSELNNEFKIWYESTYGKCAVSPKEVHEYMDKKFGTQKNQAWTGVKIRYERDEIQFTEMDDQDEYDAIHGEELG